MLRAATWYAQAHNSVDGHVKSVALYRHYNFYEGRYSSDVHA
jgi:hypothetical protein